MDGQRKASSKLASIFGFVLCAGALLFAALVFLGSRIGPRSGTSITNGCINNLRQLDGAVQQWALEQKKEAWEKVTPSDITPYLKISLHCPQGGNYTVGPVVSNTPTCSITTHRLPP